MVDEKKPVGCYINYQEKDDISETLEQNEPYQKMDFFPIKKKNHNDKRIHLYS